MDDKAQLVQSKFKQVIVLLGMVVAGAASVVILGLAGHLLGNDQALRSDAFKFSVFLIVACLLFYGLLRVIRMIVLYGVSKTSDGEG